MSKQLNLELNLPEGMKVIYRPFITLKNGQRLWAWQRGLKAFRLVVPA